MKPVINKLFFKFFLLFAVNLIFFILILSYFVDFVYVQGFLQNQFFQANVATLKEVSKSAESYLKKTDDVAKYFSITNKEALSYEYKDIKFDSNLVDFLDRQRKQMLLNEDVYSVYLYYAEKNYVIDLLNTTFYTPAAGNQEKSGEYGFTRFYDNGWLSALNSRKYNNSGFILLDTRKAMDPDLIHPKVANSINQKNIDVITVIRPFRNQQSNAKGYVIANLNENIVNEFIRKIPENPQQTTFIINSRGGVVSHENKSLLGKNIKGSGYVKKILDSKKDSEFFTDIIDGRKTEVMFVKSNYVDWIYVSTVPFSYITKNLKYLNNVIILIILLVLISGVVSVFFMTKRIYTPIEHIFEKIKRISSNTKAQMVKSEVKMIDNLLDGFKQHYDHLGSLVFDNYYLLKYNFLNRMITGECEPKELDAGLKEYKITFDREYYFVICITINELVNILKEYKLQDIYLMKQAIINIAEEFLNVKYYSVGTSINQNQIAIIVNAEREINRNKLNSCINSIPEMVDKYFKLSISIGVGNAYQTMNDLKQSYNEAAAALHNRIHKGKNAIIYFDEINYSTDLQKSSNNYDQIINFIKTGHKEKCFQTLDNIVASISKQNLGRQQVENIFLELILLIYKQLNYSDMSFEEISRHGFPEILAYITTVETIDDLNNYFRNILSILCDHHSGNKKNQNEQLITKVVNYVETHYYEDISLDSISATLKLTPQYVRKLIKDIAGVNLLDYLTGIRIKKAEELLQRTDLSVQVVSEKVGYTCYRTFLQHFRGYTGMIPTQYRKTKNKIMES